MKARNIVFTASIALLAQAAVHGALVVNLDPSASTIGPARTTADVSTTNELTYNFDASNPFFNESTGNQTFYGGYSAIGSGVVGTLDSDLFAGKLYLENTRAAGGAMRGRAIMLWDSADFLETAASFSFDGTVGSSISITVDSWNTPDPEAVKFVVRDGSNYYLSSTSSVGTGTFVIDGATVGLQWAQFDPTLFADYSGGGGNIASGGTALSYAAQTFSDVTGVGFITEMERGGGGGMFFIASDFQAELVAVPEPSTLATLSLLAFAPCLRRRRP